MVARIRMMTPPKKMPNFFFMLSVYSEGHESVKSRDLDFWKSALTLGERRGVMKKTFERIPFDVIR
jgi:hypothetical protein